jgi:alkylation response protein AidB-like acyl-CoA dehydrogenase
MGGGFKDARRGRAWQKVPRGNILNRKRARMAMNVTVDTLLDRVKDIAPILCAYAAEAEAQRRLARPVIDAMLQAGLYSMSHPKAFGGLEVDPLTMFRVVEDVAYQDSAARLRALPSKGAKVIITARRAGPLEEAAADHPGVKDVRSRPIGNRRELASP